MLVKPIGLPKERRIWGGVSQSFEIKVGEDRPARTVIATARTEEDLEGVQSGIEAWLASYGVLNAIDDPNKRSRIFPDGYPDSYFARTFIDKLGQVEEGWKEHRVKVKGLRRAVRQG